MAPRIITRPEWGARHRNGFGSRPVGRLDKWLHHTVTIPSRDPLADARQIEAIGQSRFGGGTSYTFLFHPSGAILEGLGVDRIGAHTTGRNTSSVAFSLIGNYDVNPVTQEMQDSIVWLLQEGVRRGWWQVPGLTGGHRDLKQTACPGRHAYALIRALNERAAGAPVTGAPSAPTPQRRNADGSLTIAQDGKEGPQTIARWQEVMGTPIDGEISKPQSTLIVRDQKFLNSVVDAQHIKNLTGRNALIVDGVRGRNTDIVRQFWLRNAMNEGHQRNLIGKPLDFDGIWGPQSTTVMQFALNNATAGSGSYGRV